MTPLPRFWGPCSSLTALPVFFYTWNFVDKQGRNCVICRGGDDRFKIVYLIKRPLVPKLTFFYLIKSLYFEQLGENSLNFTVCLLFSFFLFLFIYIDTPWDNVIFSRERTAIYFTGVLRPQLQVCCGQPWVLRLQGALQGLEPAERGRKCLIF